jgi:nicotinamidase-related amidase
LSTALVVIDVQQSLVDEGPSQAEELLEAIGHLIAAARAAQAQVIYVKDRRVEPNGNLHSSLQPGPSEMTIEKDYCDAFLETGLQQKLEQLGISKLVIAGMQTDYCIDTTCRSAAAHGYQVTLVSNAHSTFDDGDLPSKSIIAHHNRILHKFLAGRGSVSVAATGDVRFD